MNKIVALWVHPRSLSTPVERIMMERGDFMILHEPTSYVYYVTDQKAANPWQHEDPNHPKTYEEAKKSILSAAEEAPVYFKDMPYHAFDYVMKDDEFLRRTINTFLIREPEKTILSHFTMHPKVNQEEIGYEHQYKLFRKVADLNDNTPPIVIDADDLEDNPDGIMEAYCDALEISFKPESLTWEAGHKKEWDSWKEWHVDASKSIGIQKNMETFDIGIEDVPHLKGFYEYHLPFYEAMYKHRLVYKK